MRPTRNKISADEISQFVRYDPTSGLFFAMRNSKRRSVGDVVGSLHKKGYVVLTINKVTYYAQQVAFLLMTGEWPEETVDHENRIRSDNRWVNLRPASYSEQAWNRTKSGGKSSKYIGVSYHKSSNKWVARISADGKAYRIGLFDTEDDAHIAYVSAKASLHPLVQGLN